MAITTSGDIRGPLGSSYAFDDLSAFGDGATWTDVGGSIPVSGSQRSAKFGLEGLEVTPDYERAARRILAREGKGTTVRPIEVGRRHGVND